MGAIDLYLDMMRRALLNTIYRDQPKDLWLGDAPNTGVYSEAHRIAGLDYPSQAMTMIGDARLRNVQDCARDAIERMVPGDFMECGVWRGGACILMRAVLAIYGIGHRKVIVADTFNGPPEPRLEIDRQAPPLHLASELRVSVEAVQENFRRFGLLDEQVEFLVGDFLTTLPGAIEQLAVLRIDADSYEGTGAVLEALYDKLSVGGYCIIDDFGMLEPCKFAVMKFREQRRINEPIVTIDHTGIYWRKER